MYEKERTYLKWKYLYYNGQTEVPDSVFDELEDEIKLLGSLLPNIVGSPNIEILEKYNLTSELISGDREVRFKHDFPMLSQKKYQVTLDDNDNEVFPEDISNFFNKKIGKNINCTPKFDGNSMESEYIYGVLNRSTTRGNEQGGLDRTKYVKNMIPNELPEEYKKYEKIIIRGEVIIETKKWEDKYSNPNEVDNPRNWLAGKLTSPDTPLEIFDDIDFVAYQVIIMDGKYIIKPTDQLGILERMGFQEIFNLDVTNYTDFFTNTFEKFREYRTNSKYALDGIVLAFPTEYWDELGESNHHPYWSCAVKFVPNRVTTILEDIIWTLGKDGEYTPVAVLRAVELDGTIIKHTSLHNLGWIIDNKVYPGCTVEIAKKGEIIPQIVKVMSESIETEKYNEYIENFIENYS
jgi:DNA ligase (NAD+)